MGIGKALTRGLAAGMMGYGKYLQTVDERKREDEKTNALMMREMALAQYRDQLEERAETRRLGNSKEMATHQGSINARINTAELAARTAAGKEERRDQLALLPQELKVKGQAQVEVARATSSIDEAARARQEQREFKLFERKLGVEGKARINEARAQAQAEGDAFVGGPQKDGASGNYVFFTKSGRTYDTGTKFVPAATEGGGSARERRERRGGEPAPDAVAPSSANGIMPGTIIVDPKDKSKRMRMTASGRWERI